MLQAMFKGAKSFGLTDEEAWRALDETMHGVDPDATIDEYLDELSAELARRILAKERNAASSPPASGPSRSAGRGKATRTG
jgi:hypothetical protein